MKSGDLIYDYSTELYGIVLTWLSLGGVAPTFWEILYEDGTIDGAFEDEISMISEAR